MAASNDRLALREALFQNLECLGFDKTRVQNEHGLIFHKNMFQSANVKAMEILMHFLFSNILRRDACVKVSKSITCLNSSDDLPASSCYSHQCGITSRLSPH